MITTTKVNYRYSLYVPSGDTITWVSSTGSVYVLFSIPSLGIKNHVGQLIYDGVNEVISVFDMNTIESYTLSGTDRILVYIQWTGLLPLGSYTELYAFMDELLNIEFYKCSGKKNVLDKTSLLSTAFITGGTLRDSCDILNPTILLEFSNDKLFEYNYAYIPLFKRYYFITGVQVVRNNIYMISFKVDVLFSHVTEIKKQHGLIKRIGATSLTEATNLSKNCIDERLQLKDVPVVSIANVTGGTLANITFSWNYAYVYNPNSTYLFDDNTVALTVIPFSDYTVGQPSKNISQPSGTALPIINPKTTFNSANRTVVGGLTMLNAVTKAIYTDTETLSPFVKSIIAYPFKIPCLTLAESAHYDYLIINGKGIKSDGTIINPDTTEMRVNVATHGEISPHLILADFTVTNSSVAEFLKHEPYCYYEIYLPFYGWAKLPSYDILDSRILVYYSVNYSSGKGNVYVYNYTKQQLVFSSTVQLGIQIEKTTSNLEYLDDKENAMNRNLLLSLMGSILSTGLGMATGNGFAIAGGLLGGTKAITEYNNQRSMQYEKANTTVSDTNGNLYTPFNCYLKTVQKPPINPVDYSYLSRFNEDNGFPLNEYHVITSYVGKGYIEIVNVDYVNDTNSTTLKTESDEIVALLESGIII